MAVKYKRQYSHIIDELVDALKSLEGYYSFIGMEEKDWFDLDQQDQDECLKTMSHDIIYGLGTEPMIHVGKGSIRYEPELAQIRVFDGDKCIYIVRLN